VPRCIPVPELRNAVPVSVFAWTGCTFIVAARSLLLDKWCSSNCHYMEWRRNHWRSRVGRGAVCMPRWSYHDRGGAGSSWTKQCVGSSRTVLPSSPAMSTCGESALAACTQRNPPDLSARQRHLLI